MHDFKVTTRTIHTIHIPIPDEVLRDLGPMDDVEVQFTSRAQNRLPAPVRLSYTTLRRLTQDD